MHNLRVSLKDTSISESVKDKYTEITLLLALENTSVAQLDNGKAALVSQHSSDVIFPSMIVNDSRHVYSKLCYLGFCIWVDNDIWLEEKYQKTRVKNIQKYKLKKLSSIWELRIYRGEKFINIKLK